MKANNVSVPLAGVLILQDEILRIEHNIVEAKTNEACMRARPYQLQRHDALKFAAQVLNLPLVIRDPMKL